MSLWEVPGGLAKKGSQWSVDSALSNGLWAQKDGKGAKEQASQVPVFPFLYFLACLVQLNPSALFSYTLPAGREWTFKPKDRVRFLFPSCKFLCTFYHFVTEIQNKHPLKNSRKAVCCISWYSTHGDKVSGRISLANRKICLGALFQSMANWLLLLSGDKAVHCGEDALAEAASSSSHGGQETEEIRRNGITIPASRPHTPNDSFTKPHLLRALLLSSSTG